MPRNVLVTGGAGFIGSNFIHTILSADQAVRVVNLDKLTYAGRPENLQDLPDPARHTLVVGDICDRKLVDRLLREYMVDTVVHFAADLTSTVRSMTRAFHPHQCDRHLHPAGVGSAILAGGKASNHPCRRFHHVSTDGIRFAGAGCSSLDRRHAYDPIRPIPPPKPPPTTWCVPGSTPTVCRCLTNCSNNYGPRQFPEKLILMTLNALRADLPVYGDGQQIRDWLYVTDHCRRSGRWSNAEKWARHITLAGATSRPTSSWCIRFAIFSMNCSPIHRTNRTAA